MPELRVSVPEYPDIPMKKKGGWVPGVVMKAERLIEEIVRDCQAVVLAVND